MNESAELEKTATSAAEEVLRVIYGDDLNGCAVRLDDVSRVIRSAFEKHTRNAADVTDLHVKAFEAVELLATPPPDGHTLSAEDLRSLLGERLDKIRELSSKILSATKPEAATEPGEQSI